MKRILELLHSIVLRIPQRIALRNGMRISTYGRVSNSLFWSIFTSQEYLSFIPYLIRLKTKPNIIIDAGAAIGYFSLLMEHLNRVGIFDWDKRKYLLIEPMPNNFKKLSCNVEGNLSDYSVHKNVVGKKNGQVTFYFNRLMPWGGSVHRRGRHIKSVNVDFFDLTKILQTYNAILKLDIEGAEFDFFKSYVSDLQHTVAVIIEWHTEFGSREEALGMLEGVGLRSVYQSLNKDQRIVELLVRNEELIPY